MPFTLQSIDYGFVDSLSDEVRDCQCPVDDGIVYSDGNGVAHFSCTEHAPLYYAAPGARCDTCGQVAVLSYASDESLRTNACPTHATTFSACDVELICWLIEYDEEAPVFESCWSRETGWDEAALKAFIGEVGGTPEPRELPVIDAAPITSIPIAIDPSTYRNQIIAGSAEDMRAIPDGVVQTCITSPPYFGHRSYDTDEQIGLEDTVEDYIERLVGVFREVKRVLRDDGTAWIVIGDSYASKYACNRGTGHKIGAGACPPEQRQNRLSGDLKEMDLMMVPQSLALALRKDGWLLRDLAIWNKLHPRPEPRKTRRLTTAHEIIIRIAKSKSYYFDVDALDRVKLRNNVWSINPVRETHGHPAAYPVELVAGCLVASTPPEGLVLDPFMGSGTTAAVAQAFGRDYVGYETSETYRAIAENRLRRHRLEARDFPLAFRSLLPAERQELQLFTA